MSACKPIVQGKDMIVSGGYDWMRILDYYLTNGWVYSGDDAFVMAELVSRESLIDTESKKALDTDTWFVYIYTGNLKRVLDLIPFRKKYVAFRRNDKATKVYEMTKLLSRLENINDTRT